MINRILDNLKAISTHQGFRRYFTNTSWLFAEKVLRMVVGLFVGVWVARYLGPEQFGLLSYAQSFVGLFSAIATLGLDGIVEKVMIENNYKKTNFMKYEKANSQFPKMVSTW